LRNLQGRTGHIRLAIKHGRPIVPFVSVGGHSTSIILHDLPWLARAIGAKRWLRVSAWPLMLSFPWGLTLGPISPPYLPWPSKIIIEALEPMVFTPPKGTDANDASWVAQCAKRLEDTMEAALRRLEAERLGKLRSDVDNDSHLSYRPEATVPTQIVANEHADAARREARAGRRMDDERAA
jgi:1-acyl-sn-glycerol-3-phosphate acyltransferase